MRVTLAPMDLDSNPHNKFTVLNHPADVSS